MKNTTLKTVSDFNKQYSHLVGTFKTASLALADDVLALGAAVCSARDTLSADDWMSFCEKNDLLTPNGVGNNRRRQLLAIGGAEPRLRPHLQDLPASITVLFELSRIPAAALKQCLTNGAVTPFLQTREARRLNPAFQQTTQKKTTTATAVLDGYAIEVNFLNGVDPTTAKQFCNALQRYVTQNASRFALYPKLTLSPALHVLLASVAA